MRYENNYGILTQHKKPKGQQLANVKQVEVEDLSPDQKQAFGKLKGWLEDKEDRSPVLTLGGYAGTGKTTLVSLLARHLMDDDLVVAFCAYTGKACNVLRQKLTEAGVEWGQQAFCGTIHSLIYAPELEGGRVVGWELREFLDFDLIVVDEASMVDGQLLRHLKSYGIPILAVGDHGQLPPVGSDTTDLMVNPDVRLEKIHRQAAGNPVIMLSAEIRAGMDPARFQSTDERVAVYSRKYLNHMLTTMFKEQPVTLDTAVLCGFNSTRCDINTKIRALRGQPPGEPAANDVVICLRNTRFKALSVFNGMRGIVDTMDKSQDPGLLEGNVEFPEDMLSLEALISEKQFGRAKTFNSYEDAGVQSWEEAGMLFDWGWCLTVHKSQGSQFDHVLVNGEKNPYQTPDERRRWLYTAVTRSSNKLTLLL